MSMTRIVSVLTLKVNPLTRGICKLVDMTNNDLASRARMARLRAGYKKEADAAKAIGCSRPLVIRWESGAPAAIGNKYLLSAARVYKVRPEWLTLESNDDGYPWPGSAEVPSAAADKGRKVVESPASYAVRPDADSLRTALEITERVLTNARVSVTAQARADITLAVYDLIREGHGIAGAERTVSHMLRAVGGLTAPTE
jgi:transcriptional regulator with XRE-family HTH domain